MRLADLLSVIYHIGVGGIVSILTFPVRVGYGGEKFKRDFFGESLYPISGEMKGVMDELSKCIHCGACEYLWQDRIESIKPVRGRLELPIIELLADACEDVDGSSKVKLLLKVLGDIDMSDFNRMCPVNVDFIKIGKNIKNVS